MPGPGAAAAGERLFDTSVILPSLDPEEAHHAACDRNVSAGAEVFCTLDQRDFRSLMRPGDPRIEMP
jgi:hypothetical protein